MKNNLLTGNVTKSMIFFAIPMILGNLLQQFYNIADTLIVGRFLGKDALAAVGSSYTLMVFLTSVILGMCMGSGAAFSIFYGAKKLDDLKTSFFISFLFIAVVAIAINICVIVAIDSIIILLQIPSSILKETKDYLQIIFLGILFTFLYNYLACLLRALGNSFTPLIFLGISAVMNIVLDIIFVIVIPLGVSGAALATVIAQGFSAIGILLYTIKKEEMVCLRRRHLCIRKDLFKMILQYSTVTCLQQSIMNFGILMIQGLVNSFGVVVMAAFSAAVKIDSFAYIPVQDFGNAFSTFIAQNYGAKNKERIRAGILSAVKMAVVFCLIISVIVFAFAPILMQIFIKASEVEVIAVGVTYLRIEGACYCGIGCLFLLYGFYRAINMPWMSVILTIISLGTRVVLAYALAPIESIGLLGIWWAIPIGWFLADFVGFSYIRKASKLTN